MGGEIDVHATRCDGMGRGDLWALRTGGYAARTAIGKAGGNLRRRTRGARRYVPVAAMRRPARGLPIVAQ